MAWAKSCEGLPATSKLSVGISFNTSGRFDGWCEVGESWKQRFTESNILSLYKTAYFLEIELSD